MRRLREIEISDCEPSGDKLWLRIANGKAELLCHLNGQWEKITAMSATDGGISDEELDQIMAEIDAVAQQCGTAYQNANKALTVADAASTSASAAQTRADEAYAKSEDVDKNYNIVANKISTIESDVTAVSNDVKDAKTAIKAANDSLDDITETVGNIKGQIANISITAENVTLDSQNANLASITDVRAALEKIANKVWYSPIAFTTFKSNVPTGTFEQGYSIPAPIEITWTTSKEPSKVLVNNKEQEAGTTSYTVSTNVTGTTSVTVKVTEQDAEAATASKSVTWTFGYAIYTGMATIPGEYTESWVRDTVGGKSIKTSSSVKTNYTMQGSTDKYWWLIAPTSWSISFKTSLGAGGAKAVGTIDFVNDQGVTVPMTIYRAEEIQGSDMTITVA